ncbi:hypothetical protein [Paraburkholderia sp. J12]|uniref:hypothetical protein n=1 Tax=Paraburkholderia sp. J12 TaxID=2805432 RepID=UPI002ABD97F9|nr:hypothetical protein [Paraburkholderia sp. J12]
MQQMTFMECVKRAWASTREALTQMPLFLLGVFVAYTVLVWVAFAGRPVPGAGEVPSGGLVFAADIASLLNAVLYLVFTVKVYRFVLLREGTAPLFPLGGKPLLRMFGVSVTLTLALIVTGLVLYAVLQPHYSGGKAFLGVIVGVAWIYVAVRISLLFPSLALGNRIDLRAAWHDSHGHFWALFGVIFVAVLPLVVIGFLVLLFIGLAGITPVAVHSPGRLLLLAAGQSLASLIFSLVASSAQAWLYRRHAERLPAPPSA